MSGFSTDISRAPRLPLPLSLPMGLIPSSIHSRVLVTLLNRIFAPELEEGELAFLEGQVMEIRVEDARLVFRLTLNAGQLSPATAAGRCDLSIAGSAYDFLLLATQREDADTLFFNRRLKLGGNTELGLYVKNFLDALELDGRLGPLLKILEGARFTLSRLPDLNRGRGSSG